MNFKHLLRLVTPALLLSVAAFAQSGGAMPGSMGSGVTGGGMSSPGTTTGGTSSGTNMGGASSEDSRGGADTGSVIGPNTRDMDTTDSNSNTSTIPDGMGGMDTTDSGELNSGTISDEDVTSGDRGISSTRKQRRLRTSEPTSPMPGSGTTTSGDIGGNNQTGGNPTTGTGAGQ